MDQVFFSPRSRIAASGAVVLAGLLAVTGCDKLQGKKPVSPKACEEFSTRICKETGDGSSTCTSLKSALDLMTPEACSVAVANVELTASPDLHERYHIDAVPLTVVADRDGVVRRSFIGPVTTTLSVHSLVTATVKRVPRTSSSPSGRRMMKRCGAASLATWMASVPASR